MSKRTWLIIDGMYLAHVANNSTGGLSYGDIPTGVAFGVFRDIFQLHDTFGPIDRTIIAFDYPGTGLRQGMVGTYKQNRRDKYDQLTDAEKEQKKQFNAQVRDLRRRHLPEAGFNNVICIKGYEGDDVMAQVADTLPTGVEGILVTADEDLMQCIDLDVSFYSMHKKKNKRRIHLKHFKEEWGIHPRSWAHVKALAGCSSDNVDGIPGVGEKTAAKWLKGELKETSAKFRSIEDNLDVMQRNLPLVRLPLPGIESKMPEIVPDEVSEEKKRAVYKMLGIQPERPPRAKAKHSMKSTGFDIHGEKEAAS